MSDRTSWRRGKHKGKRSPSKKQTGDAQSRSEGREKYDQIKRGYRPPLKVDLNKELLGC